MIIRHLAIKAISLSQIYPNATSTLYERVYQCVDTFTLHTPRATDSNSLNYGCPSYAKSHACQADYTDLKEELVDG
jgi:hypothetical protein